MRLIIALALFVYIPVGGAIPWPILLDPKIDRCSGPVSNPCSSSVSYTVAGVIMTDVLPVGPSNPGNTGKRVYPVGVHCQTGNALVGKLPFGTCTWRNDLAHRPQLLGKCELRDPNSWVLTSDSDCSVQSAWSGHSGAGPGGECVVFTNSTSVVGGGVVNTPWGGLTAMQAANSGNRFCSKPLPPNVTCELDLPNIIDHGEIRAGDSSKRVDEGQINCGLTPKIEVLVNGDRDTEGVRISTTPLIVNPTTVRITTEITVSNSAVAGEHSATYVFVASPY
ncbi:Putative membrane protein [Serratia marcescens]|nr:Putative membrane protein [Serratia marcescens]